MTFARSIMFGVLVAWLPLSCAGVETVFETDIAAKDIAYCPTTGLLYVSVPTTAGEPYADHVVAISTSDASVVGNVPVGSNPGPLAASNDAAVGFVGLNSNGTVVPIDLALMSVGSPFALGSDMYLGSYYAENIAVMPGSPNTVAVSRRNVGYSPRYEGIVIFDNGVARPNADTSFLGSNLIAFGSDPGVLYGYDAEDSDSTLYRLSIDASGISAKASANLVINGAGHIAAVGQIVYASSGETVDGPTFTLLGTFQEAGPFVVDPSSKLVMYVVGGTITGFDRDTFVPVLHLRLPGASGFSKAAAGCGPGCVGVVLDSGQVFVVPNVLDPIFADTFEQ